MRQCSHGEAGGVMKRVATGVLVVVLLLLAVGLLASSASARGSAVALLEDASDGVVDGSYTAAQVRNALAVVRSDPAYMQYSDVEGVLVDYMASLTGTTRPSPTRTPDAGGSTPGHEATTGQTSKPGDADEQTTPNATEGEVTPEGDAAPATTSPVPTVTSWEKVRARATAVPWFFAVAAIILVGGGVLLRRRRAS